MIIRQENTNQKALMSGNEAIARGAYEAGVRVATGYPGTPSTEIIESLVEYDDIYVEWSANEKVAFEVAYGASASGGRAIVAMKHVGVNVAADPLFAASYTGVRAGFVIVTADDPEMHSSQNEQDNRNYARFAKVPMLEPSDSQEAKDFVRLAFDMSEEFDTPVFLRTTTRLSHSKSVVNLSQVESHHVPDRLFREPEKYVLLPRYSRTRHPLVEDRIKRLADFAETSAINRVEINERSAGIICSGVCYNYAKEVFPDYSFLKLGMAYPLPRKKIMDFAETVRKVYVFEELDPFFEEQIRAMGIDVTGKEMFSMCGEFSPDIAEKIKGKFDNNVKNGMDSLPGRQPNMCPGCPYRPVFYTLKKLGLFIAGDIGCYTLGALAPLEAIDSTVCMGASIGYGMGVDKLLGRHAMGKAVSVIGDATFLHSGIPGVLNMVYNKSAVTVVILDNRTIAMTGRQDHPGTGFTIRGDNTHSVDYEALCRSLGVNHVYTIDPFKMAEFETVVKTEIQRPEPSVIISRGPCVLHRRLQRADKISFMVKEHMCNGCGECQRLVCPALEWRRSRAGNTAFINRAMCYGCGVCMQVCKEGAIVESNE
ncbi:Indolepyruvate oxidoreductase subunit IorA [uncultured Desulfobacterium sp.]|uniref:Indolepyruvate oxidoreductase subunit IorA n=1 Tax=uncultured Desulfobacterium sp. TaxID=201089 RepID=A0A445MRK4_9BACT|nr:Indolepyruvate oxidoreductase subunit IorA [uncultured Desulfobacterium sp.]